MANHWPVQVMFNRNPSPIANIPNPRIEAQRPSPTPRVDLGRDRVDAFPQWTRMVIVRTGTMTLAAAEYALSRQQVTCFRESPPEREQERKLAYEIKGSRAVKLRSPPVRPRHRRGNEY